METAMSLRTDEEIAAVLAHFRDIAPKIAQQSAFGTNNRLHIDKQIEVLEKSDEWMDLDAVLSELEINEDDDRELYSAVSDAYDWLEDDFDETDGPFAETWDSLIGVATPDLIPVPPPGMLAVADASSPLTDEQANKVAHDIAQTTQNIYTVTERVLGRKLETAENDPTYKHVEQVGKIFKCAECNVWLAESERAFNDCCEECASEEAATGD